MDDVTTRVAKQYKAYAYPPPLPDVAAAVAEGMIDYTNPALFAPMIWPEGRAPGPLRILIAGCGTSQAAVFAYTNPEAEVVGVDLSEASLGHQRYLKEKHGLANLQLFQGDLREVGKLGGGFDLIVSTGVLHHMADPGEGLRALKAVLAPDGAMYLMVYSATGRPGVYLLQDVFRRMGLDQSPESLATVKTALKALPDDHPARTYIRHAKELEADEAIVDTFLHPQDRAYTVAETLDWLEANGLELQCWATPQVYYPDALIDPALRPAIRALPEREQWSVTDGLTSPQGNHTFVARHAGKAHKVSFEEPGWLDYRPVFKPFSRVETVREDGSGVVRMWSLLFEMTPAELLFSRQIDGRRTVGDILALPEFAAFPRAEREAFGKLCLERLWRCGIAMFSKAA